MNILDFYDDGGALLLGQDASNWRVSKFAALISSAEYVPGRVLNDSDYAVMLITDAGNLGKFPMVDAGNTALSAVYLGAKADTLPEAVVKTAATNLITGMLSFNIPVGAGLKKLAGLNESADLSCVKAVAPYVDVRRIPTKTAGVVEDIQKVAARYNEDFHAIPLENRYRAAKELHAAGAQINKTAQLYIEGCPSTEKLKRSALIRAEATSDDVYLDVAALADTPGFLEKSASILHELDMQTGAFRYWDTHIEDPIAAVLEIPKAKVASVTVCGKNITSESLRTLVKTGALKAKFDDRIIAALDKDPVNVFNSLPEPTREVIAGLCQ